MKALVLAAGVAVLPMTAQAFDVSDPATVAPILEMTKGNWVALRKWEGNEWLYFTHLQSWRCALAGIRYQVNDGDWQPWPLAPCLEGTASPNAITEDHISFVYTVLPNDLLQEVKVQVSMKDGTMMDAAFQRGAILMP